MFGKLKLIDLLRLSLRVFRTKPLRTFLTILGMSFGIATVLFLISLGYGLQYILIGKLVATEDSLMAVEAYYPSEANLNITADKLKSISDLPMAAEISPVAEFTGEVKTANQSGLLSTQIVKPNYFRLSGQIPDVGNYFSESDPSMVASAAAVKLMSSAVKPGQATTSALGLLGQAFDVKVYYQNDLAPAASNIEESSAIQPLKLKGIISDELQPPFTIIPENYLTKAPPFYKRVFVKAKDINSVEALRDKLIEKGFLISARIDLVNQATKVMKIITIILGVFGITALIVAAVGMFNTMIVSFLERIYEVGIIKSLGASERDVKNLFLMESALMGLFGGLGGVILGVGAGKLANFGISLLATKLGGKSFDLFITPMWFVAVIIISSIFIGLVSGFYPARRASYLSPKEAFLRK